MYKTFPSNETNLRCKLAPKKLSNVAEVQTENETNAFTGQDDDVL